MDDEAMLEAHSVFAFLEVNELEELVLELSSQPVRGVLGPLRSRLSLPQQEKLLKFVNWYLLAGRDVIERHGGIDAWKAALDERHQD